MVSCASKTQAEAGLVEGPSRNAGSEDKVGERHQEVVPHRSCMRHVTIEARHNERDVDLISNQFEQADDDLQGQQLCSGQRIAM
jgi:hypothetical protein